MNALQYKIVKSVLAVGANPVKFAKLCNADLKDFIAVETTHNFTQYQEIAQPGGVDVEEMLKNSIFGDSK